jgi:hypothetical protein
MGCGGPWSLKIEVSLYGWPTPRQPSGQARPAQHERQALVIPYWIHWRPLMYDSEIPNFVHDPGSNRRTVF